MSSVLPTRPFKPNNGFTLIEMAVVLLILGTLLGGLLGAISQVTENTRRSTARSDLERIEDALFGYAQMHGRLPCPATDTSNGLEDRVLTDPNSNCTSTYGFIPNASLNLSGRINDDTLLLDPWANPYRYAVTPNGTESFTDSATLSTVFNSGVIDSADMLRVCEDETNCAGTVISELTPVVFYSMGADWTATTSAAELENVGGTDGVYLVAADDDFIDTEYSEDIYDDILYWMSPYVLFGFLVEAGRLP
ncbi:MAG: prepilin-type N-terminal cleavage/methylation domain-containing protein [Porticoccaceae bacterium]|jgi:prepilin-type N-terminal cleavage/methylation domain-containing protein|nr:prepilin-type N-terminal cleavage/methylation domain-containing protein [Porticoccaceae bacterium]